MPDLFTINQDPLPELRTDFQWLLSDYDALIQEIRKYRAEYLGTFFDVVNGPSGMPIKPSEPCAKFLDTILSGLLEQTNALRDNLDCVNQDVRLLRRKIQEHRITLRSLNQIVGTTLSASRYQAHTRPATAANFDIFAGFDQVDEKSPFTFNYSRWHSALVNRFEKNYSKQFNPIQKPHAMLTNSGMAAISLALDIIYHAEVSELGASKDIKLALFYFKGVFYGEAQRALLRFADREHCIKVPCSNQMEEFEMTLSNTLAKHPHVIPVIYFDTISPMAKGSADVDFRKLRDSINESVVNRCYILADVTRIGPTDKICTYFSSSKCDYRVFEAESLAKYYLYGQDFADGGMLRFPREIARAFRFTDGSELEGIAALGSLRANNGFSFPDNLVKLLPRPDRQRFFERHARLSRNADILWRVLKNLAKDYRGIKVSFPGDPDHPFYEWSKYLGSTSSLLHFQLDSLNSPKDHSEFLRELSISFQRKEINVPVRGSYGFDNCSLDMFSSGWTRISAGSEDVERIYEIAGHLESFLRERLSTID